MAETAYILLGANIGDRRRNLAIAIDKMRAVEGLELIATSGVYVSEAVEMVGDHPSFLNLVVKAEYQYRPMELLHALERIEQELGRTDKWKKRPRPLDCDILLFGEQVIDDQVLTIPHRRLLQRPFAIVPLIEIEPDVVHPITHKPVASYLKNSDRSKVMLYQDHVAGSI